MHGDLSKCKNAIGRAYPVTQSFGSLKNTGTGSRQTSARVEIALEMRARELQAAGDLACYFY
jgi:hypothetical protein